MPAQDVAAVPYNPPGTALAALPAGDVTWYQIDFATNSYRIEAEGRQVISGVADAIARNPALTATLIGKTDAVGNDANNMRLSQRRANAVRDALVQTGKVRPKQIETRWTGQRQSGETPMHNASDTRERAVAIGVH